MMLTKMILRAASQNAACVMSCHRKSTAYPFLLTAGYPRRLPFPATEGTGSS
jgi:hypothetical protein